MNRIAFFLGLSLTLFLQSCFIADEIFTDTEVVEEDDLQKRAEENVTAYLKEQVGAAKYEPYGFNKLKIIKPVAILELEKLEKALNANPKDTSLQRQVNEQRTFIQNNNIERTAELTHFFTLVTDTSSIHVLEAKYTLNDTLGVKSMSPEIMLPIPPSYKLILDYYFNEYTILIAPTYAEARKISRSFYQFFKDELEKRKGVQAKSDFLRHALDICQLVKIKGEFNQDYITQSLLQQYIITERQDISEYEALEFSELYETKNNEDESIVGYYFFHKFIGDYNNKKDTHVVLVEFSPFYEVNQVFQLEGSFESYLNKTK